MSDKIKILFYGDAPTCATGFATCSRNILNGLYKTGKYDIKILGINYHGNPHGFPYPIWPIGIGGRTADGRPDPYGRSRAFDMMLKHLDYDVLFLFQDSFILEFMYAPQPQGGARPIDILKANKNFVNITYFPIDGIPKKGWVDAMSRADVPITYTDFGYKECVLAHPEIESKLKTMPHGVNTHDFFPLPRNDVDDFRRKFFGPHADKFIITNVSRNQQRKDIPRTMMAFKEFKKRRPNSILYLHMAAKDMGWDLIELSAAMGLKLNEDVLLPNGFTPNQGFPIEAVNRLYNASDVVISTTLGEGWGLSNIEAMAARRPIIFPDNTALTEIIGEERGFLVKSGHTPDHWTVIPNDNEIMRPLTSVPDMAEKLMLVHDDPKLAEQKATAGYEWVVGNLTWDKHVVPMWDELITKEASNVVKKSAQSEVFVSAEEI